MIQDYTHPQTRKGQEENHKHISLKPSATKKKEKLNLLKLFQE
jgi:hypothetical protein